jgi:hypothetical protein
MNNYTPGQLIPLCHSPSDLRQEGNMATEGLEKGTFGVPRAIEIPAPPPADLNLQELKMDGQELKGGTKKDEGKAKWDLLPYDVLAAVSRILTKGAQKYEARNWEKGIVYGRVFAAVMRHIYEWWNAKLTDGDGINHADGTESHLDHAITELMFLSAYEKRGFNGSELDDRPINGIRSDAARKSTKV